MAHLHYCVGGPTDPHCGANSWLKNKQSFIKTWWSECKSPGMVYIWQELQHPAEAKLLSQNLGPAFSLKAELFY